ncbi:uncharacterized protein LOC135813834 [Sycon ciliatum]|uniref:uncharacterized protein LOC135813834 n=1 Tax=Sycon ciliatum TaxID=27933 RepID=UPI0031F6F1B3
MSAISAIIQETEDTLHRAKSLLKQPDQSHSRSHHRTERNVASRRQTQGKPSYLSHSATDSGTVTESIVHGGRTSHDADYALERDQLSDGYGTQPTTGIVSSDDSSPQSTSQHIDLSRHYENGLPHVAVHPSANLAPGMPHTMDGGEVDDLRHKVLKLEHLAEQQSLELQHSYKAMAAMQGQLTTQRQSIADLQNELLPLLSGDRTAVTRPSDSVWVDLQKNINQLQQDVFTHIASRRQDEEQRKRQLDSITQQVQWTKDTARHDHMKAMKEIQALQLVLDRHEAQLGTQSQESKTATLQMNTMQRAIQHSEQALQSSRADLLEQMTTIRIGLNTISTTLVNSDNLRNAAAAVPLQSQASAPRDTTRHSSTSTRSIDHQSHEARAGSRHALSAGKLARHKHAKKPKPPPAGFGQSSGVGGSALTTGKHTTLHGSMLSASLSPDTVSESSLSTFPTQRQAGMRSRSAAAYARDASAGQPPLDSEFEDLRREDDELLAELDRYSTPDLSLMSKLDPSDISDTTLLEH